MSNEEIAARIRAGEQDLMEDLWKQVAGLIKWKARHIMTAMEGRGSYGVEFDDLYQSGYLALVAAVDTYKPESGSFASWLMFYLQQAFAEITGYRTKTSRSEPLNHSISLDAPWTDDADSAILMDIIADPLGDTYHLAVEDQIYLQQLHDALDEALSRIPAEQREVLQYRYYQSQTLVETAKQMGISQETVRKNEKKGLQRLRAPGNSAVLRPFLEFDYYGGAGLGAFKHSGMSIQERYLIYEENAKP